MVPREIKAVAKGPGAHGVPQTTPSSPIAAAFRHGQSRNARISPLHSPDTHVVAREMLLPVELVAVITTPSTATASCQLPLNKDTAAKKARLAVVHSAVRRPNRAKRDQTANVSAVTAITRSATAPAVNTSGRAVMVTIIAQQPRSLVVLQMTRCAARDAFSQPGSIASYALISYDLCLHGRILMPIVVSI